MTKITHEQLQNLILSEDDPYVAAVNMLPEEDYNCYLKAKNQYVSLQNDFMKQLSSSNPSLLQQYLKLEEAATDLNEYRLDSMYLKGVLEEHADLRMLGWASP